MIKIALADDHRMFLDGLGSILSREHDIEIVGMAEDGFQLICIVEQCKPDLILTDIRMPVKDGISTTRFIRSQYPGIRIMALSMLDHEDDIKDIIQAGASGYILKSANREELIRAIKDVMAKGTYFSPEIAHKFTEGYESLENRENHSGLTRRERQILFLIAEGKNSKQIASSLYISKFTVDTHRKNIHRKLGIKSNTGLVKYVLENFKQ